MGLNISEFLSRIGGGLGDYASYAARMQEKKTDDERQARRDAADEAYRKAMLGLSEREASRADRAALLEPAQHQADQYAKAGIMVGPDFTQNAMQAGLPQTAGADAPGMVLNALRSAGQQGNQYVASEGPQALNTALKSGGLSAPMAHGGFAMIDPSVRAALSNAATTAATAGKERAKDITVAGINAAAAGERSDNPNERARIESIGKRAEELMKPKMDASGLIVVKPGLGQAQAFRQATEEYALAKNGPTPENAVAPTPPPTTLQGRLTSVLEGPTPGVQTPLTPVGPVADPVKKKAMAQRWDELHASGVDAAAATQQVLTEFGSQ